MADTGSGIYCSPIGTALAHAPVERLTPSFSAGTLSLFGWEESSMRSIRLLAMATTVLVLGSACGGDDPPTGNGNENTAPVAVFTAPNCTVGVSCAFTANSSTDDKAITGFNWDFNGDLTADATTS